MKIVDKNKPKKEKTKKKSIDKDKKGQVLVVAQEIKFARLLSGNEKKTRDRVLKTLKKWLLNCFDKKYEFKEDDFIRVWKGLFYAVWMSDKPLVQEELCENVSAILDMFPPEQIENAMLMAKAGLRVLATEWYGIDQHRMDKFLMLVRRWVRGALRAVRGAGWGERACHLLANMLGGAASLLAPRTPHYARNATSMTIHVVDCFLEELAKVSEGELPPSAMAALLRPFCVYMCEGQLPPLCIACRRLLTSLVRQSEAGLRYQEAVHAWNTMGCPEGGPDALQLVSDDDEDEDDEVNDEQENSEKALDPRAGRVDVTLEPLPVPAGDIASMLRNLLANTTSKAHKRVKLCMQRFEQLAKDEYPLRISETSFDRGPPLTRPKISATNLHSLEKKLIASSDELSLRGLNRKHRKRLLAKSRAGLSIVEDVEMLQNTTATANGDWQVETAKPETKEDTSNKENQHKHKKLKNNKASNRDKVKKDEIRDRGKAKIIKGQSKVKLQNGVKTNKTTNNLDTIAPNDDKNKSSEKLQSGVTDKTKDKSKQKKIKKETTHDSDIKENFKPIKKLHNGFKSENADTEHSNKTKTQISQTTEEKPANNKLQIRNKSYKRKLDDDKKEIASKKQKVDLTESKNAKKNYKQQSKDMKTKDESPRMNKKATLVVKKGKLGKSLSKRSSDNFYETPKKVKFVLKNNSMQGTHDYYKSVRQSPNIPFDSSKLPSKTNLKPSTPSPINPFFKKKFRLKN